MWNGKSRSQKMLAPATGIRWVLRSVRPQFSNLTLLRRRTCCDHSHLYTKQNTFKMEIFANSVNFSLRMALTPPKSFSSNRTVTIWRCKRDFRIQCDTDFGGLRKLSSYPSFRPSCNQWRPSARPATTQTQPQQVAKLELWLVEAKRSLQQNPSRSLQGIQWRCLIRPALSAAYRKKRQNCRRNSGWWRCGNGWRRESSEGTWANTNRPTVPLLASHE